MDDVAATRVQLFVHSHWGLFGNIDIWSEFSIKLSLDGWDYESHGQPRVWKNSLYHHSLNKFHADVGVPLWHIVIEWPLEVFSNKLWIMLCHISINQQEKETRIEELSKKHTICNTGQLLGFGVLFHPSDQTNNCNFQNLIKSNDHEWNSRSKYFCFQIVCMVILANGLAISCFMPI